LRRTRLTEFPYKGGNPLSADLMAGQVPVGVSTVEDFIKPRDAGKLNIVGVFGQQRSPLLPDVPTLLEQGFSDTAVESWQAVWAPAGTPKAALEQMQAALQRAMQRPEVKARLTAMLMEPDFRPGAALDALQRKELAMWKPIIRASGFTPNQ
jgi:tripartite-type tricarboxylate transporter receptor subunit TctC